MAITDRRDEWVQPIVVDKTGTHIETVTAAAIASSLAFLEGVDHDSGPWAAWLSGRFTKTVRRANPTLFDTLVQRHGGSRVAIGASRSVAMPPVRYADIPADLARLRVSGTDLPRREDRCTDRGLPTVRVFVDQALTTGKASAQAAHALMGWLLVASRARRRTWARSAMATEVVLVPADELRLIELVNAGCVAIRDAGLTEVAPDTLTAVAAGAA